MMGLSALYNTYLKPKCICMIEWPKYIQFYIEWQIWFRSNILYEHKYTYVYVWSKSLFSIGIVNVNINKNKNININTDVCVCTYKHIKMNK